MRSLPVLFACLVLTYAEEPWSVVRGIINDVVRDKQQYEKVGSGNNMNGQSYEMDNKKQEGAEEVNHTGYESTSHSGGYEQERPPDSEDESRRYTEAYLHENHAGSDNGAYAGPTSGGYMQDRPPGNEGGNNYGNGYVSQEISDLNVKNVVKVIPVYNKLKIPVNQKVLKPFPVPVPVRILEPFPVKIPFPFQVEKVVNVPVEKIVEYPVEKPVPVKVYKEVLVPVPKPYPVRVPVYHLKLIIHPEQYDDSSSESDHNHYYH